ncbi:MAG: M23 family metallopeptidase [Flavobacteriaceae bacterium]
MIKRIALIILILSSTIGYSQKKYPQNYFQNPLEIPVILAATFGELRSNHFHAGLDLKTQKKEGLNVLASANGYVSRIKIQHGGYGKALYVTHPNGYTTVYAHLKKFSPEIEQYVKRNQYNKESYTIQLYPQANQLSVKKGNTIAFSGNTGGSTAPHLHFEIRDSSAKIINPMHFGIGAKDSKNPTIFGAYAYSLDDFSQVNQSNKKQKLHFSIQKNGELLANSIEASGVIGFGVKAFDRLDAAMNKNGIYKLELFVNNEKTYQHQLETFSFAEGKYVNLLVDYPHYFKNKSRIQKCFIVPNNKLSIYKNVINDGNIFIQNGLTYTIKIIASDFEGNKTTLIIPVKGKEQEIITQEDTKTTSHHFKRSVFNKVSEGDVSLAIPKYSFYKDLDFDFSYKNGIATIHNGSVPLHKSFTLSFNTSNYTLAEQKQLFIGRVYKNGYVSYTSAKRKENKLYVKTKRLGNYKLASDIKKPTITPKGFKNGQWLTNFRYLKVKIKDDLSGIKSYRATIDGRWVLMEYESKTGILKYDFNDGKISSKTKGAKHTLKVVVSDNVNNTKTYIATFYRKK